MAFKGTQSAMGPHWPGHYFSQFEKCLPQPEIKCTHWIHLEICFNSNVSSLLSFSGHSELKTGLLPIGCQKCSLAIFNSFLSLNNLAVFRKIIQSSIHSSSRKTKWVKIVDLSMDILVLWLFALLKNWLFKILICSGIIDEEPLGL